MLTVTVLSVGQIMKGVKTAVTVLSAAVERLMLLCLLQLRKSDCSTVHLQRLLLLYSVQMCKD